MSANKCPHTFVWPDGDCVQCGVLATTVPGFSDVHTMVPRVGTIFRHADRAFLWQVYRVDLPRIWYRPVGVPGEPDHPNAGSTATCIAKNWPHVCREFIRVERLKANP